MARTSRTIAHQHAYTGRVFSIDHDTVMMPNGHTVVMDIVRHRGSVVLIPQPKPGHVILIRQYRHVLKQWIWELPAGTLEPGEGITRAARRECEEEIGLRPTTLVKVGHYYPTPGFCDEAMTFYICRGLKRPAKPAIGDADEDIEPRTFSLADAWTLVKQGAIVDMKTVLGLAMLDRRMPVPRSNARTQRRRRS